MALSHSPQIVTEGLVLYLDPANIKCFSQGSTLAIDLSPIGNNGKLFSGASFINNPGTGGYTSGHRAAPAFVFDAANQPIGISNSSSFAGLTNMTVDIWFGMVGNFLSSRVLVATASISDAGLAGFIIRNGLSSSNSPLNFVVRDNTSSTSLGIGSTGFRIPDAIGNANSYTWNNAIFRVWASGGSCSVQMKPNGGTLYSYANIPRTGFTSTNDLFIGRGISGSTSSTMFGSQNRGIGSIKIYNRLLTEDEMLQNYNATRGRYFT